MELELVRRADGHRCRVSYEGAILETVTAPAGAPARTHRETHPNKRAAAAAARQAIAKLADEDYVAVELAGGLRPVEELPGELALPRMAGGEAALVIEGDCVVPHDLVLDFRRGLLAGYGDTIVAGIVVTGDLRVAGCIVNWEDEHGPFLRVGGSVHAEAVATGGSDIQIGGDLVVEREIVVVYTHGAVRVRGGLRARAVAAGYRLEVAGPIDAVLIDLGIAYRVEGGVKRDDEPYEVGGVFDKAVVRNGRVEPREARHRLARGGSITRRVFTSIRAGARKLLDRQLEAPEKVKTLSLARVGLEELPEEIFAFTNLRRLDLKHNRLRTLPAAIGRLTRLEELDLSFNELQRLPDEIGELRELRVLDLCANCIVELPASLARCERLKEIDLAINPTVHVCRSFGGWQHVEVMWKLPEVLTRLRRLRRLRFDATLIRELPDAPFASKVLERTRVSATLIAAPSAAHPQLEINVASSLKLAVDLITSWFDEDDLVRGYFDPAADRYDWSHVPVALALLLEINIPVSAPYDVALERFATQCDHLVQAVAPRTADVRALFVTLGEALERLAPRYPANALIDGLRGLFAEQARRAG